MTEVAWMLAGAFLCVWIVAFVGVLRVNRRSPGFSSDAPPVSVVVAARNEAPNVPRLVEALKRQEYPDDKLEIIFVDDRSEDETAAIYERETRGDRRFRLLRAVDKRLPAKKGALQLGVEAASHDLILITDGDAAPSAGWARAMAGELDAGADVAFCAVANFRASGLPNAFARYERFRVSFLTFAAAGWGAPYSAVGSGFGYRRAAYETIGGYEAIAETLSGDDDLFLREAARRGLRATATTDPHALVRAEAPTTWRDYFRQKARHTSTSAHYLLRHKIILGVWHFLNLAPYVSAGAAFWDPILAAPLGVKVLADVSTAAALKRRFGDRFSPLSDAAFALVAELAPAAHYLRARLGEETWKERPSGKQDEK